MNLTNIIHSAEEHATKALNAVGLTAASVILAYTSLAALPSSANAQQSNASQVSIPDVRSRAPAATPSGLIYIGEEEPSQPASQPAVKGHGVYINGKLVQRKLTAEEKAALARAQRDAKAATQGKMPYCDTLPASCTSKKIGKYNKQPEDCDNYKPKGRYYAGNGKVDFTNDMKCQDSDPKMNWQDWLKGWYGKHVKKVDKIPATTGVGNAPAVVTQPTQPASQAESSVIEEPLQTEEPTAGDSAPETNGWKAEPVVIHPAQSPQKPNAVSLGYKQIIRGNNQNDTYLIEVGYDRALGRFIVGARALVGAQYPEVSASTPKEKGKTIPDPQSLDQMFSREYTYKTTSEGKGMLDTFGLQAVAGLNVYQKDDGSFGVDVLLKGGAVAVLTETENKTLVEAVQSPNTVLSHKFAPTGTNNEAKYYPDFGAEVRFNLDNYFLGVGGGVMGVSNPQGTVTGTAGFRF